MPYRVTANNGMGADQIKQQITALLLQYPELADDEVLRTDMVEAETDAFEFLHMVELKRQITVADAGAAASLIAQWDERLGRLERREKAIRELMLKIMQTASLSKVNLSIATLSIANGQAHVVITDETAIPDILCRIKREPDKARIKQMLKDGAEVRGAVLSNASPHLTIRTK